MEKKVLIMIGLGLLFVFLIVRNVSVVYTTPQTTTSTSRSATVVYRNSPDRYYVNNVPSHYNSYKAQYYN